MGDTNTPMDWLEPLLAAAEIRRIRHTSVSQDMRYTNLGLSAAEGDAVCHPMDSLTARDMEALRGRLRHIVGPQSCKRHANHSRSGPKQRQQDAMHPHLRGGWIMQRPRLRYQTYAQDREILPPSLGAALTKY